MHPVKPVGLSEAISCSSNRGILSMQNHGKTQVHPSKRQRTWARGKALTGRNRRPQSPPPLSRLHKSSTPKSFSPESWSSSPLNRGLISFLSCCKQREQSEDKEGPNFKGRNVVYETDGIQAKSGTSLKKEVLELFRTSTSIDLHACTSPDAFSCATVSLETPIAFAASSKVQLFLF